jgi:outer membrane protein TolC
MTARTSDPRHTRGTRTLPSAIDCTDARPPASSRPRPWTLLVATCAVLLVALPSRADTVRLSAEEAARRILEVSHLSAAAAARTETSRDALAAVEATARPSVAATASLTQRSSVPEFSAPLNGPLAPVVVVYPDIRTAYASGLYAQQPLYTGGAITAGRSAARSELVASTADQALTTADLRLAARQAYWQSVRAQASVVATRANRERAQRLLADTQSLLDAGMAVRADVLAAQARLATAEVQVIRAEADAEDALSRLRSLLHLRPEDIVELADTITAPLPPAPEDLAALEDRAATSRPEIAGLDAEIAAAAARETLALSPTRPNLALAAQWDLARPNQRYFPQTDAWKSSWAVGVSAAWTLFDGGRARAQAAGARSARQALVAQRAELGRQVELEVSTTRRDLTSALAAVSAADSAQAAAAERERAAKERHGAGLAAMSEILDAEAALADAEQQQIDTRASAWLASAQLSRALGR